MTGLLLMVSIDTENQLLTSNQRQLSHMPFSHDKTTQDLTWFKSSHLSFASSVQNIVSFLLKYPIVANTLY